MNTQTVDTNTAAAAKTYTADELTTAFFEFPFTETTTEEELPDAAWLMTVGLRFAELAGYDNDEVAETVARFQGPALKARADGSSAFDLARFLIENGAPKV